MAAVRRELVDTADKLRFAFSGLKFMEEEVADLTTGVGALPLSEAASRVSQGARSAAAVAAVASKVLKAAELAEAAAGRAAAAVTAAQEAKATSEQVATAVAMAAVAAAQRAKVAAAAAAALEGTIYPPLVPGAHKRLQSGVAGIGCGQGFESSGGAIVGNGRAAAALKTTPGEGERDEEEKLVAEENNKDCGGGEEEEEDEEDDEEDEEESTPGKRKLRHNGKSPSRRSARAAGSRQPDDAESPTREPSKRQRKASVSATGAGSGSGAACATPEKCAGALSLREGGARKKCDHSGCTANPRFGVVGSKEAKFCPKHAKPTMKLKKMTCCHPRCTMRPLFGMVGSMEKEFCSEHANPGMVKIKIMENKQKNKNKTTDLAKPGKRCRHGKCTRPPSFGIVGSMEKKFCLEHTKPGMVMVTGKGCRHPECTRQPRCGMVGSTEKEFCFFHAKPGMVNLCKL